MICEKVPQCSWAPVRPKKSAVQPKKPGACGMLVSYRTLAQVIDKADKNGRISARGAFTELSTTSNYSAAPAQVNKTTDGDK